MLPPTSTAVAGPAAPSRRRIRSMAKRRRPEEGVVDELVMCVALEEWLALPPPLSAGGAGGAKVGWIE